MAEKGDGTAALAKVRGADVCKIPSAQLQVYIGRDAPRAASRNLGLVFCQLVSFHFTNTCIMSRVTAVRPRDGFWRRSCHDVVKTIKLAKISFEIWRSNGRKEGEVEGYLRLCSDGRHNKTDPAAIGA